LLLPFAAFAQVAPAPAGLVEEVPYITTPDNVTAAMLDIAGVKAGDHLIDLGSGDGRIVIAAARRGATGLGVEIDPRLVEESIANARTAGVGDRTTFRVQDLFETDLARATVVTMYLLPEVNLRLRPSILALKPGTRIVSHDWDMGDWQPDRSLELPVPDKSIGLKKSSRVLFWVVPARVEGLWCGADGKRRATLRIRQAFQRIDGEAEFDGRRLSVSGMLDGAQGILGTGAGSDRGEVVAEFASGGQMRLAAARGALDGWKTFFWRFAGSQGSCPGH
jgi:SAM-dependent methyltransferase